MSRVLLLALFMGLAFTRAATAYPIEVLVFAEQGEVKVATVDGMYRMKMFFEDALKMKFAANMGMPGSIEDEIGALATGGLPGKP